MAARRARSKLRETLKARQQAALDKALTRRTRQTSRRSCSGSARSVSRRRATTSRHPRIPAGRSRTSSTCAREASEPSRSCRGSSGRSTGPRGRAATRSGSASAKPAAPSSPCRRSHSDRNRTRDCAAAQTRKRVGGDTRILAKAPYPSELDGRNCPECPATERSPVPGASFRKKVG